MTRRRRRQLIAALFQQLQKISLHPHPAPPYNF
jgi:hypothetical protein